MIAYIPPERYIDSRRPRLCRRDPTNHTERARQWDLTIRYGAVYNLEDDTTRLARPDEYKRRKNYKVFPDDFKDLMKIKTGPEYWR